MYARATLKNLDPKHLISTYSQEMAEFLIENGVIPLKNDKGLFYYIKSKKTEMLIKRYNKKGGKLI